MSLDKMYAIIPYFKIFSGVVRFFRVRLPIGPQLSLAQILSNYLSHPKSSYSVFTKIFTISTSNMINLSRSSTQTLSWRHSSEVPHSHSFWLPLRIPLIKLSFATKYSLDENNITC
uniref:Ovule protein n=1 Tax=Heterorhabditis bacteriophora TaxID=37862 RepID=A0A1I7WHW2_HETBA